MLGTVLNDKDIVMNLPMDPIISRILRRAHLGSQCCFQLPECPLHAQLQRQILSKTNELQSSWLLAFTPCSVCLPQDLELMDTQTLLQPGGCPLYPDLQGRSVVS